MDRSRQSGSPPSPPPKKQVAPSRRLLLRGESVIASTGLAVAAILMLSLAAAGAWTVHVQRQSARQGVQARIDLCGTILAQTLEPMLAAKDDLAARKTLVTLARQNNLERCRIVLADGKAFVDADEKLTAAKPAAAWPPGTPPALREPPAPDRRIAGIPLSIPERGEARLELAATVSYPGWSGWEAQTGIGGIAAGGFLALWLVYRRLRSRLGAMGAIREALLSMRGGDTSADTLSVSARLGPEAVAWNALLVECDQLRAQILGGKARESLGTRKDLKTDLASACDALSQGLLVVDEQLRLKYSNGAAAAFLRAKREDLAGSSLPKHLKDAALLDSIKAVCAGNTRRRTTLEVKRPEAEGGGVLRFTIRPVRRDDAASAIVLIEDITQQRVADEAKGAFVAQTTHELRTPLTNIRLYVEQAIDAGEADPAARTKALNIINQEARRLERIVGDMLSVSEMEAGSFKLRTDDVRMEKVFEDLRAEFEAAAADKGLALKFDLPPKFPVIRGDRDKLVLAVHNLVGNALKYTPKGGTVTVRFAERDGGLAVDVADSGIGISPEEQELIFERFYRAKDKRISGITGSGLGLALAREVARLHGGDISVKSKLDQGSTFSMTIPARAEAA